MPGVASSCPVVAVHVVVIPAAVADALFCRHPRHQPRLLVRLCSLVCVVVVAPSECMLWAAVRRGVSWPVESSRPTAARQIIALWVRRHCMPPSCVCVRATGRRTALVIAIIPCSSTRWLCNRARRPVVVVAAAQPGVPRVPRVPRRACVIVDGRDCITVDGLSWEAVVVLCSCQDGRVCGWHPDTAALVDGYVLYVVCQSILTCCVAKPSRGGEGVLTVLSSSCCHPLVSWAQPFFLGRGGKGSGRGELSSKWWCTYHYPQLWCTHH